MRRGDSKGWSVEMVVVCENLEGPYPMLQSPHHPGLELMCWQEDQELREKLSPEQESEWRLGNKAPTQTACPHDGEKCFEECPPPKCRRAKRGIMTVKIPSVKHAQKVEVSVALEIAIPERSE